MEDRKRDIFNNNLKSSVEVAVSHSHDEKKENAAAQRKNGPKKNGPKNNSVHILPNALFKHFLFPSVL